MTERQRKFREKYVSEISPWYNGLLHVVVMYTAGIAAMPAVYMTPMWTSPLYQGLISETYFSRKRRWRSVIMGDSLALNPATDILVVDQSHVK